MKLYLAKIGDTIFDYNYIGSNLSILELNKNADLSSFPKLNNNDFQMIKNSGGTVLYRNNNVIYWLVNIDHILDEKIGVVLGKELTDIVRNIISGIKRDLTINKVL